MPPDPELHGFDGVSLQDFTQVEVCSVSKRAQSLERTAAAVFVLTQEDIRRSGAMMSIASTRDCQVLFVGRVDSEKLEEIHRDLRGATVLLVSDIPDFAKKGGVRGSVSRNKRVGLERKLEAVRASGLPLSPNLLKVGKVVVKRKKTVVE